MDVLNLVKVIFRRWMIVAPVLAITATLAFVLLHNLPRTFEAEGSLLVAAPPDAASEQATGAGVAPLSTSTAKGILAEAMSSGEVRDQLLQSGASASYAVEADANAPILRITASAQTPGPVLPTVNGVIAAMEAELADRQRVSVATAATLVRLEALSRPTRTVVTAPTDSGGEELHTASASVLLVGPADSSGANPYVASSFTSQVMQQVLTGELGRQRVMQAGGDDTYEVRFDRRDAAPLLYVSTTGESPGEVMRTFDAVVAVLEAELAERQEATGAAPSTWVELDPLALPAVANASSSSRLRPVIAVMGLGLAAAVGLALLVESLLIARDRRRDAERRTQRGEAERTKPSAPVEPPEYERVQ